jgi:hypothetical protein
MERFDNVEFVGIGKDIEKSRFMDNIYANIK